jgi:hypothetical protein
VNISMKPQQVDKESAWYYESAGSSRAKPVKKSSRTRKYV